MIQVKRITLLRYITVGKLSDGQVFDTSEGKFRVYFRTRKIDCCGFEKGLIDEN
jgi:FKBP-type peptidyl-prolyl cis-trans isomerase SlpA